MSFLPISAKKGTIGVQKANISFVSASSKTDDFANFLFGLEGNNKSIPTNVKSVEVKKKVKVFKKNKVLKNILKNTSLDSQLTVLKMLSIEANFDLLPLLDNKMTLGCENAKSWCFPPSSVQLIPNRWEVDSKNHRINRNEFWSQSTNKATNSVTSASVNKDLEVHIAHVKDLYIKWQQALFFLLDLLFHHSSNCSAFHILGESSHRDIPDLTNGIFVSAVFSRTTATQSSQSGKQLSATPKDKKLSPEATQYSCILIGVSKHIRKRLVEAGAKPYVLEDTVTVDTTGLSTLGHTTKAKTGENVIITGRLAVGIAAHIIDAEVSASVAKLEQASHLPVIYSSSAFPNAVPHNPLLVVDDGRPRFNNQQMNRNSTDSHQQATSADAREKSTEKLHKVHLEGDVAYSAVSAVVGRLVELGIAAVSTQRSATTATDNVNSKAITALSPNAELIGEHDTNSSTNIISSSSSSSSSSRNRSVPNAFQYLQTKHQSALPALTAKPAQPEETVASQRLLVNPMMMRVVKPVNPLDEKQTTGPGVETVQKPYFKMTCVQKFPRLLHFNFATHSTNSDPNCETGVAAFQQNQQPDVHVSAQDTVTALFWTAGMRMNKRAHPDWSDDSDFYSSDSESETESESEVEVAAERDFLKGRRETSKPGAVSAAATERVHAIDNTILKVKYLCQQPKKLVRVSLEDLGHSRRERAKMSGGETLAAMNEERQTGKFVNSKQMTSNG